MPSDLVSLLSGGGTDYSDPAALAAPQIKLAQAMMQSGLDTSPVGHPLQAVARMAQAGLGGVVQGNAVSDLAKAYAGTAEGLAKSLEKTAPGHPLIAALRSPDPNVRMMAVKEGVKGLTSIPEQQWERQKFWAGYNKPDFGQVGTDETGLKPQYGFRYPAQGKVVPYNAAPSSGGGAQDLPRPTSEDDFKTISSGTRYMAPDGSVRVKP